METRYSVKLTAPKTLQDRKADMINAVVVIILLWGIAILIRVMYRKSTEEQQVVIRHEKGTIIVCPGCRNEIATSNRDIYYGEYMSSDAWEGIEKNEEAECKECGMPYVVENNGSYMIHTSKGWVM